MDIELAACRLGQWQSSGAIDKCTRRAKRRREDLKFRLRLIVQETRIKKCEPVDLSIGEPSLRVRLMQAVNRCGEAKSTSSTGMKKFASKVHLKVTSELIHLDKCPEFEWQSHKQLSKPFPGQGIMSTSARATTTTSIMKPDLLHISTLKASTMEERKFRGGGCRRVWVTLRALPPEQAH